LGRRRGLLSRSSTPFGDARAGSVALLAVVLGQLLLNEHGIAHIARLVPLDHVDQALLHEVGRSRRQAGEVEVLDRIGLRKQ
jgi:hypothetical protein